MFPSGTLSLSRPSAFHDFNPEKPWRETVSSAVFCVTLDKGVRGLCHSEVAQGNSEWSSAQMASGAVCSGVLRPLHRGTGEAPEFVRFLQEQIQRQTEKQAVRRNPVQDLPSGEEKRT